MSENDLEKARKDINRIDEQILDALEERMEVAGRVARYKMRHALPVLDPQREQAVIDNRTARAQAAGLPAGTAELFRIIMRMSRSRQEEILAQLAAEKELGTAKAAYQGVPGANSHLALVRFLGEDIEAIHFDTFEDVFQAVESGSAAYGVLPIENSFTGSVLQVYDLLGQYAVYVVGERSLPISHALVGVPGASLANIRTVLSHEQALAQCARFFKDHPQISGQPYYNTAGAAKFVSEQKDPQTAALANPYAAHIYGLRVLIPEAATSPNNTTRFILISARPYGGSDANKALVRFTLAHAPGTLAQALSHFASYGLNMAKIESRPVHERNFEYAFYADFEGPGVAPLIHRAVEGDASIFADLRILGIYRKQKTESGRLTPGEDAETENAQNA